MLVQFLRCRVGLEPCVWKIGLGMCFGGWEAEGYDYLVEARLY